MPKVRSGRYAGIGKADSSESDTIVAASPELLGELVQSVLRVGDAVLFGVTKDGGSVRVILMSGDEKTSEYLSSADDLDTFCRKVSQHITDNLT